MSGVAREGDGAAAWARAREALSRAGLLLAAPPDLRPSALADDSRKVEPGALFLALPGTQTDGHRFVADAARRGAVGAVVDRPAGTALPEVLVRDARLAARVIAAAWFGRPADALQLVGVTGTNGKTTTTLLIGHLLGSDGRGASIGTLGARLGDGTEVPSPAGLLTTPGPVDLQATLAALAGKGVRRVALEASSHSLDQGRLDGLVFAGAVYTNLTRDHLDYHGTMEAYLLAKLRLAEQLGPGGVCAVNADDPAWEAVAARHAHRLTFGRSERADLRAEGVWGDASGSRFRLAGRFGGAEVAIPLPGDFNVVNALGAAACAVGLGVPLAEVAERLASAPQVPGRMERLCDRPCTVLRDYAHTHDALERVLRALRPLTPGRLIVVFGCGGDRDRGKRPLMGRVAADLSDLAVVTSDNPRSEDPERILDDIVAGMGGARHERLVDRRQAIARALDLARPGDTLVLAGKGHETYQVVGAERHPFDEREIVLGLVGRPGGSRGGA